MLLKRVPLAVEDLVARLLVRGPMLMMVRSWLTAAAFGLRAPQPLKQDLPGSGQETMHSLLGCIVDHIDRSHAIRAWHPRSGAKQATYQWPFCIYLTAIATQIGATKLSQRLLMLFVAFDRQPSNFLR